MPQDNPAGASNTKLKVGNYVIEWANSDELRVSWSFKGCGEHEIEAIVCGGDFESILSFAVAAFQSGHAHGREREAARLAELESGELS